MSDDCTVLAAAARSLADRAVEAARQLTRDGEVIDAHQVVVERVAYTATEARVIEELANVPAGVRDAARVAAAELAADLPHRLAPVAAALGIQLGYEPEIAQRVARWIAPGPVEAIGIATIESAGRLAWPLDDMLDEVRANVR